MSAPRTVSRTTVKALKARYIWVDAYAATVERYQLNDDSIVDADELVTPFGRYLEAFYPVRAGWRRVKP